MFRQYLRPVLGRDNLTVVTGAQVQQVVTEAQGNRPRARGVTFSTGGPDGDSHSGALLPHESFWCIADPGSWSIKSMELCLISASCV